MKVNYNEISRRYDRHRSVGGPYMPQLVSLAGDASDVLELGCGTGNVTAAFAEEHPCRLVAVDLSAGMIERAREKGIEARWVLGSALDIPLRDRAVDFVFGVFFLQHIADVPRVVRESARVLDRGAVAFVTASTEFIKTHPMNRYFPTLPKIDLERFRTPDQLVADLKLAWFEDAGCSLHKSPEIQPVDAAFVEKVAAKYISTYELIPEDEFESGLLRLRRDVAEKGRLDDAVQWEYALVWGRR